MNYQALTNQQQKGKRIRTTYFNIRIPGMAVPLVREVQFFSFFFYPTTEPPVTTRTHLDTTQEAYEFRLQAFSSGTKMLKLQVIKKR